MDGVRGKKKCASRGVLYLGELMVGRLKLRVPDIKALQKREGLEANGTPGVFFGCCGSIETLQQVFPTTCLLLPPSTLRFPDPQLEHTRIGQGHTKRR